jgi:ribonuclease R
MPKKQIFSKDPFSKREAAKYTNPIPSREYIINCLSKNKIPLSHKQLITRFNLTSEFKKEALRRRLRAMARDGQLMKSRGGKYALIRKEDLIQGHIIGNKEGFGFVAPEDGTTDIYLSPREMRKVFDGDLATVRIINIDKNNRREGIIVDIIERKLQQIVGKFFIEGGIGFVEPDNSRITQNIIIPFESQLDAKPNQIVAAEITTPPTSHAYAIGRVVEILGNYMAPGMEIEVATRSFGLPHKWPEEVLQETANLPEEVAEKSKRGRIDLRNTPLVTIDGKDAKDFDDAVYCEKKPKGGWRLIVAIADVSHYVKPNAALDKEAKERGNSVYFPGKVIPMLPHVLSNGLCSLKPNVDRLCVACDMSISTSGEVTQYQFYPAIMRSHARLTYDKVMKILEEKNQQLEKQYSSLLPHIKNLHQLYKVLYKKRCEHAVLEFETPEVKVEFGANRKIKRLYTTERNDAHKLIEECMLCANISAAKFLTKHKADALFRVHDGPNITKFANLKIFLNELGLSLGGGDLPTSKDYAKLIEKIKTRPDAHLIQTILLRSLSQAFYSPNNDGHFGLAFAEYTHFTSPIRRYPDLTIHRTICAVLNKKYPQKNLPDYEALQNIGKNCSVTERRADEATREALNWLKCEYMLDKLGGEFDGIVTGVTGFGIFVELSDIFVQGLVHITTLDNDYYHFDPIRHRLIGERSGKIYRLGDPLKVKVVRVDLEEKQIDFILQNKKPKKNKT